MTGKTPHHMRFYLHVIVVQKFLINVLLVLLILLGLSLLVYVLGQNVLSPVPLIELFCFGIKELINVRLCLSPLNALPDICICMYVSIYAD